MNPPGIQLPEGTSIGYGKTVVARAVETIDLGAGNHFLLARNGRGKTTLLRTLARSLPVLAGVPEVAGSVQFIGEYLAFDHELTPRVIFKAMLGGHGYQQALELADATELLVDRTFGLLSRGNRQKVLLILAEYRARPDSAAVLLLDEPFTGLDAHARERFMDVWQGRTQGILRLITAHPDYDSMDLRRPVVITNGEIRLARPDEGRSWGQLKQHLV